MALVGEVIGALVQAQRPDRVLRRLEARRDQLLLEPLGIRGKKVEVDGRAERRARIATRDLRTFQEQDGLVGRRTDAGEDVRRDRIPDGRELLAPRASRREPRDRARASAGRREAAAGGPRARAAQAPSRGAR